MFDYQFGSWEMYIAGRFIGVLSALQPSILLLGTWFYGHRILLLGSSLFSACMASTLISPLSDDVVILSSVGGFYTGFYVDPK